LVTTFPAVLCATKKRRARGKTCRRGEWPQFPQENVQRDDNIRAKNLVEEKEGNLRKGSRDLGEKGTTPQKRKKVKEGKRGGGASHRI